MRRTNSKVHFNFEQTCIIERKESRMRRCTRKNNGKMTQVGSNKQAKKESRHVVKNTYRITPKNGRVSHDSCDAPKQSSNNDNSCRIRNTRSIPKRRNSSLVRVKPVFSKDHIHSNPDLESESVFSNCSLDSEWYLLERNERHLQNSKMSYSSQYYSRNNKYAAPSNTQPSTVGSSTMRSYGSRDSSMNRGLNHGFSLGTSGRPHHADYLRNPRNYYRNKSQDYQVPRENHKQQVLDEWENGYGQERRGRDMNRYAGGQGYSGGQRQTYHAQNYVQPDRHQVQGKYNNQPRHHSQPNTRLSRPNHRDKSEELRLREARVLSISPGRRVPGGENFNEVNSRNNRQPRHHTPEYNFDKKLLHNTLSKEDLMQIEYWSKLQRECNSLEMKLSKLRQERDRLIRHEKIAKGNEKLDCSYAEQEQKPDKKANVYSKIIGQIKENLDQIDSNIGDVNARLEQFKTEMSILDEEELRRIKQNRAEAAEVVKQRRRQLEEYWGVYLWSVTSSKIPHIEFKKKLKHEA